MFILERYLKEHPETNKKPKRTVKTVHVGTFVYIYISEMNGGAVAVVI